MKSTIQNSRIVGIDLGTTFTEVAYIDDTGKPKIIPNRDGDYKMPSVIYVGPDCKEILVGAAAENMSAVEPTRVIREFKRDVGTDKIYFTEGGIPTRHTLAQAIKPLLDRIEKVTLEAIQNAKVNKAEIKHVLRIGGSSRLSAFEERIKQLFGADCLMSGQVSPDMAVGEGAALHAAKLASAGGNTLVNAALQAIPMPCIKHSDAMPHSLGVGVQDRVSSATYCSTILERNRALPCQAVKSYGSVDDRQTRFKISVLQGEEGQATADCLVVGEKELELPARKTSEPSIEVTMGYDASGMVRVNVRDLISGRTEDITVDFYTKN